MVEGHEIGFGTRNLLTKRLLREVFSSLVRPSTGEGQRTSVADSRCIASQFRWGGLKTFLE
jgi:hypothetical protein